MDRTTAIVTIPATATVGPHCGHPQGMVSLVLATPDGAVTVYLTGRVSGLVNLARAIRDAAISSEARAMIDLATNGSEVKL